MKLLPFCLSLIALCGSVTIQAQELGHTSSGTQYGNESVLAYANNRHGPDGAIFLDPYFLRYLQNLDDQIVLDAGCGAAPWAIYAAQNGARVYGIDVQEGMILLAQEAVKAANLEDRIDLTVGDVAELPYANDSFDRIISINVGCNLPSTTQSHGKAIGLGPHIKEMARVLKSGGLVVLTGPTCQDTAFTNGSLAVKEKMQKALHLLPENPSSSEIVNSLKQLDDIYRASFVLNDGVLCQVTRETKPGAEIWRKLPGLAVPNYYHPETEYLKEIEEAGLIVKECFRPRFSSHEELAEHNATSTAQLGQEYVTHHCTAIFVLTKP